MSAFTCGFCGRVSTDNKKWKQIFIRPADSPEGQEDMMLCPACYEKYIGCNIGRVWDETVALDAELAQLDDEDPVKGCIGMSLRDFLCSDMYLQTQDIFFRDSLGLPVVDYMPMMSAKVTHISKPDEKGRRYASLDGYADPSPDDIPSVLEADGQA